MVDLNDILESCNELDEKLCGGDRTQVIRKHLDLIETKLQYKVPDFQQGLDWLNVSESLSLSQQLSGKIVILDFFTYCCINCMHILPDLEAIEERFSIQDGVVVVGVHSAKFENERILSNILSAVLRYNIHHPVVNDNQAVLWSELQIACWPTLVILGPSGQFLYQLIGEGHRERLIEFISVAKQYYDEKDLITKQELPIKLEPRPTSPLQYPGKICVSDDSQTIVISDTGNHRIVVTDKSGQVKYVIGAGSRGNKDGSFSEVQFSSPQGVCIQGTKLYIADTDNHLIRQADLETRHVTTLAGTGNQGNDKEGGKMGTEQKISSPWDICIADSPDGQQNTVLYIAMAGTHQIWAYLLHDVVWYKNRKLCAGTCLRLSGSGLEENRNNSYPEKAGFAQPSGITVSMKLNCLYVADSESSSIRSVQLKDGGAKNVVGGDIDPKNLFAYGDVDGVGNNVKLQHPLGVTMATEDGPLLLVDSYNHKVKSVDVKTRTCQTLLGTGHPGDKRGGHFNNTELNEPGGIASDWRNKLVYIADTNNHDIKVMDLESQKVYSLPVIFSSVTTETDNSLHQARGDNSLHQTGGDREDEVIIKLTIQLTEGVHLNEEAPNTWSLYSEDDTLQDSLTSSGRTLSGELSLELIQILTSLPVLDSTAELCLKLNLFVCEDSGVCRMDKTILKEKLKHPETEYIHMLK